MKARLLVTLAGAALLAATLAGCSQSSDEPQKPAAPAAPTKGGRGQATPGPGLTLNPGYQQPAVGSKLGGR